MTTQTIIIVIAIVMILVIALAWGRGGARVTQITRTKDREKHAEDGE